MDNDGSGHISIEEFFQKFDLQWSSFNLKVFGAIDFSGENSIDFGEFFVGFWNFCTLTQDSIIKVSARAGHGSTYAYACTTCVCLPPLIKKNAMC